MKPVSFMHTADLHLGTAFPGLAPRVGNLRRRELMQAVAAMADICSERNLDLLMIAGNFWEQDNITRPLVDFIADQFRRIPYTRVLIAPGERDYYHDRSLYNYPWPPNVHVFRNHQPTSLYLADYNLTIHGLAWQSTTLPKVGWNNLQVRGINIILAHGDPEILNLASAPKEIAYIALGGSHVQKSPAAKIFMPGSPEPLTFASGQPHGVLVGYVDAQDAAVDFVPLAKRQYHSITVSLSPEQSPQASAHAILGALAPLSPEKNIFRLRLTGTRAWPTAALAEELSGIYQYYLEDESQLFLDFGGLKREGGEVVARFIAALSDQPSPSTRQALEYGLDALLGRRVELWLE